MKTIEIRTLINELSDPDLLDEQDRTIIQTAEDTACQAYAPYSGFKVGAALILEDQTILTGNNQENAAYPSGLCAERVALFSASALHPDKRIKSLAIVAYNKTQRTVNPVYPCGSCRQVMVEIEDRQGAPIRLILAGEKKFTYLRIAGSYYP